MRIIESAYLLHGEGETVNPPSYFLRFADRPTARIIALPASVGGKFRTDGLKWISSFPRNIDAGLPRASAVVVLNDYDTGYPRACLEGSIISACRTAGSAVLAAHAISDARQKSDTVGFVGAGMISRYVYEYLVGSDWPLKQIHVYDLNTAYAEEFATHVRDTSPACTVTVHDSAENLIRASGLVVFATVAATPHVSEATSFAHNPLVLHLSLRDLAPDVLLDAVNIVDDVDHALRAKTSLQLAEEQVGDTSFVAGTLHDVLTGWRVPEDRPVVFSPFGLGVLDIALAKYVYDTIEANGELNFVDGFFYELRRHG